MTATPDQVIAQIREALEAGPTPGEWVIDDPNSHLVARLVDGAYEYICVVEPSTFSKTSRPPREDDKNARFIAACNPQNIAALLALLDSLRKAKWDVKHVATMNDMASMAVALESAEAENKDLLAELSQSRMEIMGRGEAITILEAERDALLKALAPFSKIAGEMFARNWNAKAIVVALDTPEDSHRLLAGDFFRARTLSGDKSWTAK